MEEHWRSVKGVEGLPDGLYEISDHGHARSVARSFVRYRNSKATTVRIKGRVLATNRDPWGYVQVQLPYKGPDGRQINCRMRMNVLILETFVGPRPRGMVARHLNDVPDDNRLENLCWGTQSQNRYDSVANSTHGYARRTHCKHGHEYTKENTIVRRDNTRACRACDRRRSLEYRSSKHGKKRNREYMRRWRAQ
jgi:HNH endonuclease/NUMOD4 motif